MDYWLSLLTAAIIFLGGWFFGFVHKSYINTAKSDAPELKEGETKLILADLGDLRVFDVIMAHGQPYKCVEMSSRRGGDYATEYEIILRSI